MADEFKKHEAITKLLDLDLTCPHCGEVLVEADERRKEQNTKHTARSGLEESKR